MSFRILVLVLVILMGLSARAQTGFYGFIGPSLELYGSLDPVEIEEWASSTIKDVRACFAHPPASREIRFEVVRGQVDPKSVELSVSYHNGFDERACVQAVLEQSDFASGSGQIVMYTTGRIKRWQTEDLFFGRVDSPELYIGGAREPQRFSSLFEERDRELVSTCLTSSRLDDAEVVLEVTVGKIDRLRLMQAGRFVPDDDRQAAAYACLRRLVGREYPDQLTRTPVVLVYSYERAVVVSESE